MQIVVCKERKKNRKTTTKPFVAVETETTNRTREKERKEIYDILWHFMKLYLNSHKLNLSFFHCSMHAKNQLKGTVAQLLSRDYLSDVNRFLQINWSDDKNSLFCALSPSFSNKILFSIFARFYFYVKCRKKVFFCLNSNEKQFLFIQKKKNYLVLQIILWVTFQKKAKKNVFSSRIWIKEWVGVWGKLVLSGTIYNFFWLNRFFGEKKIIAQKC